MSEQKVRVIVVDDHPAVRAGVGGLLELDGGFELVAEAGDAMEAAHLVARHAPDVVIMDLRLPGQSGIDATRAITKTTPGVAVLMLTMVQDDASIFAAIRAGARGYVRKEADQQELVRAVKAVANGEFIASPGIAQRVAAFFSGAGPGEADPFPGLTEREHEVLELMASGYNNQTIARRLFLSPKTVRNHISSVFSKLQVADRSEAIVRAREAGLGSEDKPRTGL